MAAGSAIWGAIANRSGVPNALLYASLGLAAGLVTMRWHRLRARVAEPVPFADAGVTQV
jgi:hypothetical protein